MWIIFIDVNNYAHENSTKSLSFKGFLKVMHIIHTINNMNI